MLREAELRIRKYNTQACVIFTIVHSRALPLRFTVDLLEFTVPGRALTVPATGTCTSYVRKRSSFSGEIAKA